MSRTLLPYLGRSGEAPSTLAATPMDQRLLYCTDKTLSEWVQLTPAPMGHTGEMPEKGLLVVSAPFQGPLNGLLSVAASESLGRQLAVASTGDLGAANYYREALLEFARLLRECILTTALKQDPRDLLQLPPHTLPAEALPLTHAQASLRVLVQGQPVEIRLWLEPPIL